MSTAELKELFARPNHELQSDVVAELQSILRMHSLSEQELFFKWEAYSIKLGTENIQMDYRTAREFKKDLQDTLERESRGKAHTQSASKKGLTATPRNANSGDVYGVLDGLVSSTPRGNSTASKRKANFQTPSAKSAKAQFASSPSEHKAGSGVDGIDTLSTPFASRSNAGQVIESLNAHITLTEVPADVPSEARVKLKANTELAKFNYRPMAMKLSEASEILDDRIDEFAALIQEHHNLPDSAFGNPAAQSTAEIIAVGRIASDSSEGKMNKASIVLETSRRMGAGLRSPLRMENVPYDIFPGKIVAVKGTNPSGEYFSVNEILSLPLLPPPASKVEELQVHESRQRGQAVEEGASIKPLNILVASGPFTTDTDLSFAALHALIDKAEETVADVLILSGPFLDLEHPLIASGDFELPADSPVLPDRATLTDAFRALISAPLTRLTQKIPSMTIILVPSVRDAISKHVSWPQDRFPKRELGLPKQVTCVTNPITLSINEIVVGISSQDVLYEMQRQTVAQAANKLNDDVLARLAQALIQQRHFFPVFPPLAPESLPKPAPLGVVTAGLANDEEPRPATGACLDIAYLKLGEWLQVRPDMLITPSALTPFAKVVESVVVVNPGTLSKRRGAGTFAQFTVVPRKIRDEEVKEAGIVGHELFDRARVDIVRI